VRFATKDEPGTTHVMKVVDISMSGMAFVVDREQSPFIYDLIKVEIPLHGGQQVAWWAKVVRMEEYAPQKWYMKEEHFPDDSKILIGVHFNDLPPEHAKAIQQTLKTNFEQLERQKQQEYMKAFAWLFAKSTWQVVFYVFVTAAAFWAIWALSQPSENYTAEKGAPWGQRFFYSKPDSKDSNPNWDNSTSNPQRVPSAKDFIEE
jgi:hypothetical protein